MHPLTGMVEPVWHPFYRYVSPNGDGGTPCGILSTDMYPLTGMVEPVWHPFYRYASPNGDGGA